MFSSLSIKRAFHNKFAFQIKEDPYVKIWHKKPSFIALNYWILLKMNIRLSYRLQILGNLDPRGLSYIHQNTYSPNRKRIKTEYIKTQADIRFIKTCKTESLIPTFAKVNLTIKDGSLMLRKRITWIVMESVEKTSRKKEI